MVLLVCALAGCASIPTSGPVVAGAPVEADSGVRALVQGPGRGDDPVGIVRGFLRAVLGAGEDYEVARTFLERTAAARWLPSDHTIVYAGEPTIRIVAAGGEEVPGGEVGEAVSVTAQIDVAVVGTLDAHGRYVQEPAGARRLVDVQLSRENPQGQWRISSLENLSMVSASDFDFLYRSGFRLYFLDPTRTFLVPEQRWFPQSEATATRLVAELLDGPSPWLASAVVTAFPAGTELAPPSAVPTRAGQATVPLTPQARNANGRERSLMQAQLLETLQPVLGISSVRMTVDSGELTVPADASRPRADPEVRGSPVLVAGERLVRLDSRELVNVKGLPDTSGLGISHPGMGYTDNGVYAVLAAERTQLRTVTQGADAVSEPLLTGADLTAPSFDWRGWVWTSPAASTGTVFAARADSSAMEVMAPWLQGRRVTSLRLSRDGTRAAVVSTAADGSAFVDLAGVDRSSDGTPTRLTVAETPAAGPGLVSAQEAVWVEENVLAVLGRRAEDERDRVLLVEVGGTVQDPLTPVDGSPVAIAAGNGERSVLVATGEGGLLVQAGAAWVEIPTGEGVRDPAFEG